MEVESRIYFERPNLQRVPAIIDEVVNAYFKDKTGECKVKAWELKCHCSDGCKLIFVTDISEPNQIFFGGRHGEGDIIYSMESTIHTDSKEVCCKFIDYMTNHLNHESGLGCFEVYKGVENVCFKYNITWTTYVNVDVVREFIAHTGILLYG